MRRTSLRQDREAKPLTIGASSPSRGLPRRLCRVVLARQLRLADDAHAQLEQHHLRRSTRSPGCSRGVAAITLTTVLLVERGDLADVGQRSTTCTISAS
jgi:hypothetical protein